MAKASTEITNLPVNELEARLDKARAHLAAIEELLPGLVSLDHEGRVHSSGRLRDGEVAALGAVLDAVSLDPASYDRASIGGDEGQEKSADAARGMKILRRLRKVC